MKVIVQLPYFISKFTFIPLSAFRNLYDRDNISEAKALIYINEVCRYICTCVRWIAIHRPILHTICTYIIHLKRLQQKGGYVNIKPLTSRSFPI